MKQPDCDVNLTNFYNYGGILAAMCRSVGLPALDDAPQVYIPPLIREKIDALALPTDYLVVHAVSNATAKDWPASRWQELLTGLAGLHPLPVLEIGSVSFVGHHPNVKSLCGQLSILESAEVIRRARLFVGIDSGPAHLANAVGTPGVILLGSYLGFEHYTPFSGGYASGENAALVRANGVVASVPVEPVLAAVLAALSLRGL
jgi:ADP-heptose:LPS heptosyltransferase